MSSCRAISPKGPKSASSNKPKHSWTVCPNPTWSSPATTTRDYGPPDIVVELDKADDETTTAVAAEQGTSDPVRMYLKQMGQVPLLTALANVAGIVATH